MTGKPFEICDVFAGAVGAAGAAGESALSQPTKMKTLKNIAQRISIPTTVYRMLQKNFAARQ